MIVMRCVAFQHPAQVKAMLLSSNTTGSLISSHCQTLVYNRGSATRASHESHLPVSSKAPCGGLCEQLGVVLKAASNPAAGVAEHQIEIIHGRPGGQLEGLHSQAVHAHPKLCLCFQQIELHLHPEINQSIYDVLTPDLSLKLFN